MTSNTHNGLFGHYKTCTICSKRLPDTYKYDFCPSCKDAQLLHDVKDFIRENDVNEYQVADFFDIPVAMVKNWIREGRIEYRAKGEASFSLHCQRCGAPVSFGSVCPKCIKLLNGAGKGYGTNINHNPNERMHFLNQEDD